MRLIVVVVTALLIHSSPRADTLRVGWAAWSDAEVMSRMAKLLVEEHTEHRVERVLADLGIQYSGIASGHLDFMMMSWQPETHRDYLEKFGGELEDLGVLYEGARLGWAVPDYIPESAISSIADLARPENKKALGWRIQGVDPGAGITRLSEAALETYNLHGYQLQYASGAGMAVALRRAIDRQRWIVVTAWRPHWIFGQHNLRFLEDPEGALSEREEVHALARENLSAEYPEVTDLLRRMYLPLSELEQIMLEGERTSYQQGVEAWMQENRPRVNYWLTGKGAPP